jgi:hypothetical protein
MVAPTTRSAGRLPESSQWFISGNGKGVEIAFGSTGNTVEGNFIGTEQQRQPPQLGNGGFGVLIFEGSNNVIGSTSVQSRNIISGSLHDIFLANSTDNIVQGNYIGTDVTGTTGPEQY